MENKFTQEELQAPITLSDFIYNMDALIKHINDNKNEHDEKLVKLVGFIRDLLINLVDHFEYNRNRDLHFLFDLLNLLDAAPSKESLVQCYEEYCKEFDRLNNKDNKDDDEKKEEQDNEEDDNGEQQRN